MAGHLGNERVTTQNIEVVKTDVERGLILVRGAVPGAKGGWIQLRDAVKRQLPEDAPVPGRVPPAGRAQRRRQCRPVESEQLMMKADIQNLDGEDAGTVELPDAIFGLEPREDILHRMVQLAVGQAAGGHAQGQDPGEINRTDARSWTSRRAPAGARHGSRRRRHFRRRRQGLRAGGRAAMPSTCRRRCGRWR